MVHVCIHTARGLDLDLIYCPCCLSVYNLSVAGPQPFVVRGHRFLCIYCGREVSLYSMGAPMTLMCILGSLSGHSFDCIHYVDLRASFPYFLWGLSIPCIYSLWRYLSFVYILCGGNHYLNTFFTNESIICIFSRWRYP